MHSTALPDDVEAVQFVVDVAQGQARVSKPADSPYVSEPSPWRKTLNPAYTQKTESRGELFTRPRRLAVGASPAAR